jgi:AraC family cel operon transcriptional repressor
LHDHDFHELVLLTAGESRHHVGDATQDLAAGDLVFVRPQDRHGLQARGDQVQVVVAAFHPDLIAQIGARHPELAGRFFWSGAALPDLVSATRAQAAGAQALIDKLDASARDRLAAEAFLLPLCAALVDNADGVSHPLPSGAPDWLHAACLAARDPVVFRDGAAGFARVAGRAHPHVSRTVRRYLGQSPSDYVNRHRMAHAARRLAGTSDSIADIAADCGIPNLSHFHKLFRQHHGTTPLQYRKSRQRDLIQPG